MKKIISREAEKLQLPSDPESSWEGKDLSLNKVADGFIRVSLQPYLFDTDDF